jgi:hypothetical protein
MGREFFNVRTLRSSFHHVPDRLRRNPVARYPSRPVNPPKDIAGSDSGGRGPLVNFSLHSGWNRDGANMFSFADQVRDDPVILSPLMVVEFESCKFSPSQPAAKQDCNNARSRLSRSLSVSRFWSGARDCSAVNQFPIRTPSRFAPLTRWMPVAS